MQSCNRTREAKKKTCQVREKMGEEKEIVDGFMKGQEML